MKYRITLEIPPARGGNLSQIVFRDTDADAIDAAKRKLRLYRNVWQHLAEHVTHWSVTEITKPSVPRPVAREQAE